MIGLVCWAIFLAIGIIIATAIAKIVWSIIAFPLMVIGVLIGILCGVLPVLVIYAAICGIGARCGWRIKPWTYKCGRRWR